MTPASAEQAIVNLLADYCWYVDRKDIPQVLALFTDDAIFDLGFGRVYSGRSELRNLYDRLDTYVATSHHMATPRIDLGPGTATVRTGMYAYHEHPDGQVMHLWGVYSDELCVVDGVWHISHRTLRASGEQGTTPAPGQATRFEFLPRA